MSLTTDNGVLPPVVSMVNVRLTDTSSNPKTVIKAGEIVWFLPNGIDTTARIPGRSSMYSSFILQSQLKYVINGVLVDERVDFPNATGFPVATTTILSHDTEYHSIPICVQGVTEIDTEVAENIRAGQVIWFSPFLNKIYSHPGEYSDERRRVPVGRAIHNEKSIRTSGQTRLISVSVRPCTFGVKYAGSMAEAAVRAAP